jgi:hypothetical protein
MELHQLGRYLYPAGDDTLRRFTLDRLVVAYSPLDRLATCLPDDLRDAIVSPGLRVRRWRLSEDGCPSDAPGDASADEITRVTRAYRTLRESINGHDSERWIVAVETPRQARRQIMAVLFNGRATPEAVLKIRPTATGREDLVNERDALERVAALPAGVRDSVPRLLRWDSNDRHTALSASWIGGRSVYADVYATVLPPMSVGAHFQAAIDWLLDFQDASRVKGQWDLDELQQVAMGSAEGEPDVQASCERALAQVREWAPPRTLRLVASHGDFWPRNVILDDRASMAGIVDWERFSPATSPFDDLFHFAATYGLAYRWIGREREDESWARTFLRRNRISRAVRRFLGRYCLRRGLQPSLLMPLLQLHLITRHRDARRRGETTPEGDTVWMQGLRVLARTDHSLFSG